MKKEKKNKIETTSDVDEVLKKEANDIIDDEEEYLDGIAVAEEDYVG